MATLYVVGTPIGNLDDISLRALRVLAEVDCILCEDTRVSKKLLSHFGINKPTMSYHAHTDDSKTKKILDFLREGKSLALVSDAGTPSISDPGSMLVSKIYEFGMSVQVVAIPGPSAVTSALSISGIPSSDFLFLGFLPHKKGRETLFKEIASSTRPVVFYESPHRILKCLRSLQGVLGTERIVVVCRELTKIHEEVVRDTASGVLSYYTSHPDKVRGEFVVVVGV
jgi:16S rRNA (cytidine1402-2'-O)-methyltransferase